MNRKERIPKKETEYEQLLREVKDGNRKAKRKLAWLQLTGSGGAEVDKDNAVVLLEECVKDDDAEAMWMLGLCYEYGFGCEKNVKKAKQLYARSCEEDCMMGESLVDSKKGAFNVSLYGMSNETVKQIFEMLTITPFKTLCFNQCGFSEDEGLSIFCEGLRTNSSLTELDMIEIHLEDCETKVLCEALKSNSTLKTLILRCEGMIYEGAKALSELLTSNSTLIELDLGENGIGAEGTTMISEALKTNSTLTEMSFYYNGIGDEGAEALSKVLVENSTLTKLNLGQNGIGDKGAKMLSEALMKNSRLTCLDLSYNAIGNEGARMLRESLKKNPVFKKLDLKYNNCDG